MNRPGVDHDSGALHCNRALTSSMWSDVRHELGLERRDDDVAMGWREEPGPGFVGHATGFALSFVKNMGMGQVKAAFGGR